MVNDNINQKTNKSRIWLKVATFEHFDLLPLFCVNGVDGAHTTLSTIICEGQPDTADYSFRE